MEKKEQERKGGKKERAERARERMGRREIGEGKGESSFKELIMDGSLHRQSDRQRRRSSQRTI